MLTWLLGTPASIPQRGHEVVDLAVLTPCTKASMITAHRARSMRPARLSRAGKKLP